ncbi:MAG: aminotransferase class I/II-fold pyridoxal phosphate-dependent enzyme [bacterium]
MRTHFIAASPNTEKDDNQLAFKLLLQPGLWFKKTETVRFESEMANYLGNDVQAFAFDSARSSFYLLLKLYGVGPGDEVILPSFSCLVIANPVIWLGAKPVYVDINAETFNIDLNDLKRKVTDKTKVILVQHTFGLIIDVSKVRKIVGKKVKIIEDTAHTLGNDWKGKKVGTLGDAAILTFGIEKMISTVRGGMAVTSDPAISIKLKKIQATLPNFSRIRVLVSLLNPLYWNFVKKIYYWGIAKFTLGRIFTWIGHQFGLLGNMIELGEYDSLKPDWLPAQLPGALSILGVHQLQKLDRFNLHRRVIFNIYEDELQQFANHPEAKKNSFLRYPLVTKQWKEITAILKQKHIVVGDWYHRILFAPPKTLEKLGYQVGMTPAAEKISQQIINLPTNIQVSTEDASEIVQVIINFLHKK